MGYFGKENHYYNGSIRRYTVLFGSIFSDLYIRRTSKDNKIDEYIKVPLKYGRGHAYEKTDQSIDTYQDKRIRQILPAMAFTLESLEYDSPRKLNKHSQMTSIGTDANNIGVISGPLPYNLEYQLDIRTKNMDDMLQIIEQIIPLFNQGLTIRMNEVKETYVDVERDVTIKLVGQEITDNSEDQYEDARFVNTTLTFEVKAMIWSKAYAAPRLTEVEVRTSIGFIDDTTPISSIFTLGGENPNGATESNVRLENQIVNTEFADSVAVDKVDGAVKNTRKKRRDTK